MSRNVRQYPNKSTKQTSRGAKKQKPTFELQQDDHLVKLQPDVRKKFTRHDVKNISPLTQTQAEVFHEWDNNQNLVLQGAAGTGKSFISLYLALDTILDPETEQDKIIIVRSATPTKDIGFLPGTEEEKLAQYERPYIQICDELFHWKNSYKNLKEIGLIDFQSTSFLRGLTFDNAVIIFDEFQNGDEGEIDTVITRTGMDSRVIISGDTMWQNDIGSKSGGNKTMNIVRRMPSFSVIDFEIEDIVRSGLVREYLMAKYGALPPK